MRYPCFALGCVYLQAHSPLLVRHLPQWATLPSRFHQQNQPCRQVQHWKQPALRPSMGSSMTRRATKRSRAFLSNEAVSYYHHLDSGSEICLVGVIHDARASSRLVEKIIRKSKPKVVMVEVDAYRIKILPPGEATKDEKGLCWWTPLQEEPARWKDGGFACDGDGRGIYKASETSDTTMHQGVEQNMMKSLRRKRQSKKEEDRYEESKGSTCEFNIAAMGAVACGARVLLGDRDFEETERRLAEAGRADKEDVTSPERTASGEKKTVEARIKRRGLEETSPAAWRKLRDLEKSWKPRKFKVLITERDEVMANSLMMLGRNQHTVAIVGAHHIVGIGGILVTNGWKPQRK